MIIIIIIIIIIAAYASTNHIKKDKYIWNLLLPSGPLAALFTAPLPVPGGALTLGALSIFNT